MDPKRSGLRQQPLGAGRMGIPEMGRMVAAEGGGVARVMKFSENGHFPMGAHGCS